MVRPHGKPWEAGRTRNDQPPHNGAGNKRLTYISDFGRLSVVPNRFQPQGAAFFIDWDMVQVNYLRPFQTVELAQTGDADKRMILAEFGLQVNNEKGLGVATDLATS